MSEINRELQQGKPLSEAMRKLFPDAPKLSEEEAERIRQEEQSRTENKLAEARIALLEERLRAESQKR